ncbi:MAG: SIMPL domain-containing protein [Thermoguttaceae bacterium]
MLRTASCALLISLLCSMPAVSAVAAERQDATLSSSGSITVRPAPTRLRMQVQLRAYGKTPAAAAENLKIHRDAAVERLKELKADPASVSFGTPRVGPAVRTAPVAYAVPVVTAGTYTPAVPTLAPAVSPSRPTRESKTPPMLIATTTLRAEWALPPAKEGSDRLAAAAAEIEQRVRAGAIDAGVKDKLSAEEQEQLEEMQLGLAQAPLSYRPHAAAPTTGWLSAGGPTFVFVAILSETQRKAALADACAQAKRDATELAAAAGMKLGPIVSLNGGTGYNVGVAYTAPYYSEDDSPSPLKKLSNSEVVATRADGLEVTVGVSVTYRLLTPESTP